MNGKSASWSILTSQALPLRLASSC
ncbi:hypothetical protein ENH_00054010 [Eimeria necatrix]|uniref:Uncharacterized protein n=1 Tax=Eimeria necatrix TaxID=51315 RepID=U6MN14_9EIME|nr:hypothetical protein ENH_00054010 [Eimeria necatrix]CDJ63869.1 hypothetical protein ENH_00054010 [Eimeria necatrix]